MIALEPTDRVTLCRLPSGGRIRLEQISLVPSVVDAKSTSAIGTVKSCGPLSLDHLPQGRQ